MINTINDFIYEHVGKILIGTITLMVLGAGILCYFAGVKIAAVYLVGLLVGFAAYQVMKGLR